MNQIDRDRLARLYSLMSKWPWYNRYRTVGPAELSEFAFNMEKLQPMFMEAIMGIARPDTEDPDESLDLLESAIIRMGRSDGRPQ